MEEQDSITDRYQLVEELSLSSGGLGTVWRGYDDVLDRKIAVKLIRPDVVLTPGHAEEFVRRFRREARVTARTGITTSRRCSTRCSTAPRNATSW